MSKRCFGIVFWLFILLGAFFGLHLSKLENLETFKVLNVIGLFYDILGLVILSEVLSTSERFQKFVADIFSGLFMWAHMGVPIGIVFAGLVLSYVDGFPSANLAMGIGGSIFVWMVLPSFIVEDVVLRPKPSVFSRRKAVADSLEASY